MGWFKRNVAAPEPPTLVRFANGKFGVRRRVYRGGDYSMLDMRGDDYWWCTPKYWPGNAQADEATARRLMDQAMTRDRECDLDDVGTPA